MKECPTCADRLKTTLTMQGVVIDACPSCEGIWLDKDEMFHFVKQPDIVKKQIEEGKKQSKVSLRKSPASGLFMQEISMFDGIAVLDYCSQSGGFWLDKAEVAKIPSTKFQLTLDQGVFERNLNPQSSSDSPLLGHFHVSSGPTQLPNLTVASMSVLFGMYAIISLVLITGCYLFGITPLAALFFGFVFMGLQFLIAPFVMDLSLRFLYKVRWSNKIEIPKHLEEFVGRVCQEYKIRFPKIGIIPDGAPQAFTYGHHPNNGRIVISQGILDLLEPEEVEAVVAHEIGHMIHWDMLVMTAVQMGPLVLHYLYRRLISIKTKKEDSRITGARYLLAIGAYILYVISEYIVLWFSRVREYYADRFSGQTTAKPERLVSALIKIGYGLAGKRTSKNVREGEVRSPVLSSLEPLGIMNIRQSHLMALAAQTQGRNFTGEIDKQVLQDVAKWELWNPWAMYYEFHSTHPLIAKRIKMLNTLTLSMGKEPYIEFNEQKPESYWDDFIIDIFIYILPTVVFVSSIVFVMIKFISLAPMIRGEQVFNWQVLDMSWLAFPLFLLGVAYLIKIFYSYPHKQFAWFNIRALLKKIKVSPVSAVPCQIKGTIIGRGVPGLIYSEDFVMRDDSGIIYLDYQQPVAFFNFLFGLLRAAKYQQQEVEVKGWYRRGPIPYIELKELKVGNQVSVCYVYHYKLIVAVILIVVGLVLLIV